MEECLEVEVVACVGGGRLLGHADAIFPTTRTQLAWGHPIRVGRETSAGKGIQHSERQDRVSVIGRHPNQENTAPRG